MSPGRPPAPPRFTSRPCSAKDREAALRGDPEDGVQDDVERSVLGQRGGHVVDVTLERDDDVRAGRLRARAPNPAAPPPRRPLAPSTRATPMPTCPTAPPPTEHQHALTGLQPATPRQGHPGRDPRQAHGGGQLVRDAGVERARWRRRGTATSSAREPSPGCIPAVAKNHTRVPARRPRTTPRRRRPDHPARTASPARRSTTSRTRTGGPAARWEPPSRGPASSWPAGRRRVLAVRRRPSGGVQHRGLHRALMSRCPDRAARGAGAPGRRRSGTPTGRGRARTSR